MASRKRPLVKAEESVDEDAYAELHAYYCEPYTERDAPTLSGTSGAKLRHPRTRPPRLEQNSAGYKALRKTIGHLKRTGDRAEILRLLHMLRDWEMRSAARGLPLPPALRDPSMEIAEVVDIADEQEPIDVDAFILDVLIVKEVRVKSEIDGTPKGGASSSVKSEAVVAREQSTRLRDIVSSAVHNVLSQHKVTDTVAHDWLSAGRAMVEEIELGRVGAPNWQVSQLAAAAPGTGGTWITTHPMMYAVACGNLPMCQWLLEHGAKITGHVYPLKVDDATLMYLAACSGHLHICEWLAQSGARADVLVTQWDGKLPLYGAILRMNEHVARWLMLHGGATDGWSSKGAGWERAIVAGKWVSSRGFYLRLQRWAEREAEREEGEFKVNLLHAARCMKMFVLQEADDASPRSRREQSESGMDSNDEEEFYWGRQIDKAGGEDKIPLSAEESEDKRWDQDIPNDVKFYRWSAQGRACSRYDWQERASDCHFAAFRAVRKELSDKLEVRLGYLR